VTRLLQKVLTQCINGLCVVITFLISYAAAAGSPALSVQAVTKAIQRRICFESFWWGDHDYLLGSTEPIAVRVQDDIAYVWSDRLSKVPYVERWANFFVVYGSDGHRRVTSSGFNVGRASKSVYYQQSKALVFTGQQQMVELAVPSDCSPRFDKDAVLKEHMLEAVESGIAYYLASENPKLPDHLEIKIANFNVDYQETQVFVPMTGEAFAVKLYDSKEPWNRAFARQGLFLPMPIYGKRDVEAFLQKLAKYEILRDVDLGPWKRNFSHPGVPQPPSPMR